MANDKSETLTAIDEASEQKAKVENMIEFERHCSVQYDISPNRRQYHQDRADALRAILTENKSLANELRETKAKLAEAVTALRDWAVGVDEMSWHGELMRCHLCLTTWNNGRKAPEDATPERHETTCLLYTQ